MSSVAPADDPAARRKRAGRKYTSRACEECRRRRAKVRWLRYARLSFRHDQPVSQELTLISVMELAHHVPAVSIVVFDASIQPRKMEGSLHPSPTW